jgi:predicted ATP-dependent serine protease
MKLNNIDKELIAEKIELQSKENKALNSDINSNIIAKNVKVEYDNVGLDLFDKFKMTKKRREELKNMKFVIDGLIVENYHTYLMGNAGSGKTTILLHLCFEMVKKGYKVFYFYLDGALNTASKVDEEIERLEIESNFNLLVDGTMKDYKEILEKFISTKSNFDKTVFILDTFKFLSADVNHKNANKDAMHLIKEVCKLGATFISLGHTNKDGERYSGTAEIEQDSDGVLRIDGIDEANNQTVSTIKKGGRCRFDVKETSFTFRKGNILSVEKLDEVVDTENQLKQKETEKNDKFIIDEIKRVLRLNPNILQKDIIPTVIENTTVSKNKILKILNTYVDIHWKRTQSKEALNGYEYKVIDTNFDELIENFTNKLNDKVS